MIATNPQSQATDSLSERSTRLPATDSAGARRELVRRIVHSPTFARSERLGTLLTYVCDMALKGRESEINEQRIGQAVFGRSQDYDSAVDGIVRSQASRLRQRLDLYYQRDGAGEPIRIVIPRGGYIPVFEAQTPDLASPSAVTVVDPLPETVAPDRVDAPLKDRAHLTRSSWAGWIVSLVLALLLATVWFKAHRAAAAAGPKPLAKHLLWSRLFTKGQRTMVVAPDSGLVLYHAVSAQDVDLKSYLDAGYRSEVSGPPEIGPVASHKDLLLNLANRRYTSIVDVEGILSLKDRAHSLGSDILLRYARDLRPNDLKSGTVILFGASSANPWDELFERNMNFILEDDYTRIYAVLNRHPQPGEPSRWESVRNDPQHRVFGIVAFLPSLNGDGDALILEGTSMAGTEAASDFANDDAQLMPFLDRIRHSDGTLPHFEVLLGTQNMGASSVRSQILAWRTIN